MNESIKFWIRRQFEGVRTVSRDLNRDGRGRILVAVAGGWFLSLGVRLVFPALIPYFREAFGLTLTTSGLLISVLWYAYALGQFPGGYLGDRFGERSILVASTVISTVTILLVALAWSRNVLFIATAFFGLATALYGTIRFTILTDVYSKRDGTAVALTLAAGDIGNALLPPVAVGFATVVSWRLGIGFNVPLFLFMGVLLWRVIPPSSRSERPSETNSDYEGGKRKGLGDRWRAIFSSLRYLISGILVRSVLVAAVVQFLAFVAWQGFTSFYVTYLIQIKGLSTSLASVLFGVFFLMGLLVRPVSGTSYDVLGPRTTLAITMTLITLGLATLPFAEGFIQLLLLTIVLSSLLGFTPATQTTIANGLPSDIKGSGLGLLRTSYMVVGASSAIVVGYLADIGHFDGAFFLLAVFSGLAVFASLLLPPKG